MDEDGEKFKSYLDLDYEIFKDEGIEEHNNELFNLDISSIKDGKTHYFCKKCKYFPYIQFENQFIIFTCKCGKNKMDLFFQNENASNIINESNLSFNNFENNGLTCKESHKFKYYCTDCHKNLCKFNCQNHLHHVLINFDFINFDIYSKVNELIKFINQDKENESGISNLNEKLDEKSYLIIDSDENAIKIEKGPFFELIRIIIDDYLNYPNYSHFFNIDSIYRFLKNHLINNKNKERKTKINNIIKKYNIYDYDYMDIKYRYFGGEIKLFGDKFVENNKNNAFIINEEKGEKIELTEKYKFKNKFGEIDIKLVIIKEKINMNYMFYNCIDLISLDNISNWKKTKAIGVSHLFYNCLLYNCYQIFQIGIFQKQTISI